MNAPFETRTRPITIAIFAMGGEGGGVLADWIIDLAEHSGYLAQLTSGWRSAPAPPTIIWKYSANLPTVGASR